jgi:thiol-disulfide isomerase/thioredoxin
MNKKLMLCALMLIGGLSASGALSSDKHYRVSGSLTGVNEGDTLCLTPSATHNQEQPIALAVVKDGKFIFEGTLEEPRAMMLGVKNCFGGLSFMLEEGETQMVGAATSSAGRDNVPFYRIVANVTGSPLTDRMNSLLAVRDTMDRRYNAIQQRYAEVSNQLRKAYTDKNMEEFNRLKTTEEYKAMATAEREFLAEVDSCYTQVMLENKDSYWGPLMMMELASYLSDNEKKVFAQFSKEAQESYYGRLAHEELYPAGDEGEPVKEFTVTNAEGKQVSLKELLQGKKYLLIDFWASWCGPCRREIPNLKEIYKNYADKGFQIVSISIDQKEADWQKALKEEALTWPNFRDSHVAELYKVRAIPTMYLIDSNGRLVAENLRGAELAQKVAELLK